MANSDIKKLAKLVGGEDVEDEVEETADESALRKYIDTTLKTAAKLVGDNLFDMQQLLEAACAEIREQIEGMFEDEDES